ncbi:MAG: type II toxin-antitoxin system RelE/ParE family toxin [Candidatus Sulfotelmatobacter sp.]
MAWTIDYAQTARKQLQKLDKPTARRILDFLDDRVARQEDPRSLGKALKGVLGTLWCYRVGDYRVICEIQHSSVTILVVRIGHRREVYR